MSDQYTIENRTKLEAYLATHSLPIGLGNRESACTLAAINLAITGKLTADIPKCMSLVLGRAAIRLQDTMPDQMRNSERYKRLIPDMPGTGRKREAERLAVMMDWTWTVVLPQLQPLADNHGFGPEWRNMCEVKTATATRAALTAIADLALGAAAAYAANAAAHAANAAHHVAAHVARGERRQGNGAVFLAARAAAVAARAADAGFWEAVDPIGVLERMTYLGEEKK